MFVRTLVFATALAASAPAYAAPGWTIYSSQLSPSERAGFWSSRLGEVDPFGDPVDTSCSWSRIQIPTARGLEWVAQEDCSLEPDNEQ